MYKTVIGLYIEHVGVDHWPPTRFDVVDFLNTVTERASETTAHTYWKHLRTFLNYVAYLDGFNGRKNPVDQIRHLKLAPRDPNKEPKGIFPEHIDKLFEHLRGLPTTLINVRDLTLIHFLYRTGCRSGEAATLEIDMLNLSDNCAYLDASNTKDNEDKRLYYNKSVKRDLDAWLTLLKDSGYDAPWLFPVIRRNRYAQGAGGVHITVRGVHLMFQRRLKEAGLPMYTVHDLRHTFTKEVMEDGRISLASIQRQLGHASPQMVLRYAKVWRNTQKKDFSCWGDS